MHLMVKTRHHLRMTYKKETLKRTLGRNDRQTIFSPCRTYRYTLWREWDMFNSDYAMVIGLNPSTATEILNDPTVRRCIGFSKSLGMGALCMTNIFSFRATKPADMKAAADPVGPDNDHWLQEMSAGASIIIAAWGVHGAFMNRGQYVASLIGNLHCFAVTKEGHPKHPLYLAASTEPVRFNY